MIGLSISQKVMIGTSLLGCVAGLIGCFAVLRRRALIGDMLAHTALPGLCVAYLIMQGRSFFGLLLGALVAGLLGVGIVTLVTRWTRTKEDAAIGIVLSTFFGAGIVLLSIISRLPIDDKSGLATYLFGQAASMRNQDLLVIGTICVVVIALIAVLYREFKVYSFDPDFARALGWPTVALDLTMMGLLAVVTIIGLPAVGVVLMSALIIIPAATARFWTDRLGLMLVLSGLIGCLAGLLGTSLSSGHMTEWLSVDLLAFGRNRSSLPTGPLIVLSGTAMFIFSMLFAPRRGIIAGLIRDGQMRRKFARERRSIALGEPSEIHSDLTRVWQPGSPKGRADA